MASVIASCEVDRGFEHRSGRMTIKLACVASPLSTKH